MNTNAMQEHSKNKQLENITHQLSPEKALGPVW